MKTLISYEEFAERYADNILPETDAETKEPKPHVKRALEDATGIIVSHLGWLIDKETGDIVEKIPAQFERYSNSISLLEKIDKEYKGGLSGPNLQSSFIVDESDKDGDIADKRFFRKGEFV